MRRSICYTEPPRTVAGEVNTWKFTYTPATSLPKGARLKLDIMTTGRELDWEIPSTNLKESRNIIFAKLDGSKPIAAKEIEYEDRWTPDYEFILPSELEAGQPFTIYIGSPKPDSAATLVKNGNRAQTTAQRRRSFVLSIDPTGKGNYSEEEMFTLDVRGANLERIRVLTPSFVVKNKRFDVILRFEDSFGNLTSNAPEDTLIELSYEQLRENLNWKLFIPETGFIILPNLYFNETGFYTICLTNTNTKKTYYSSPIKCFSENDKLLFWGLLHGESERFDSSDNIESCMRHFRDERALSFYASSCFESQEETPNEIWKSISQNITEFDEPERFTTFLGFQWYSNKKEEGIRHFIYSKEGKPILRAKDAKSNSLKKIYRLLAPKEAIAIPCFTMAKEYGCNFEDFNPEFERVVEIYNAWGSSECTEKEGNQMPIHTEGKAGINESAEGSIIKALKRNLRFGFVAGGLDDRGVYSAFFESDQVQYFPGYTAIMAKEQSRQSLFDALYNRACYATTGARIIMGLELAGHQIGSEVKTSDKPGLMINRHLSGYVAGTTDLEKVEIIRNGEVIKTFEPKGYTLDFAYDDMKPFLEVTIDAKDKNPPFAFYYLRATQKDGHMAWSSPIWVDYLPIQPGTKMAKAPLKGKPFEEKKEELFDEDFEEEEEFDDLDDIDDIEE
jgi:Protein of unknown function (DUF3604)